MERISVKTLIVSFALWVGGGELAAQIDTTRVNQLEEVVVTGARYETDVRHLPMTVSVIEREKIEQSHEPSLLPLLTEQVPGMFVTSRGVMGYGVSGGAAGGMSLRGLGGGSARLMVLIDGHPQYMGLMGHPIADSYQGMMAERVE
ncbi:MAG: TonB-dependent receptor plug domain-containing protein, partial [Bacteroides sp.]|nr:TonB-dependent receptor plug domain-containing protein [Bacteroides sp.]